MDEQSLDRRLSDLESRLARLETMLTSLHQLVEGSSASTEAAKEGIKSWVTDYVSLRLQQLVPETCEHAPEPDVNDGPRLPGTSIRCTEEVVHRLGRIPIPFVRQMVTQKVAEQARAEGLGLVDVAFFERAATF
jgi:uncharacterized coiled-coil protein SlyX